VQLHPLKVLPRPRVYERRIATCASGEAITSGGNAGSRKMSRQQQPEAEAVSDAGAGVAIRAIVLR